MNEHMHSYGEYQRRMRLGLPYCAECRAKATEYQNAHRRKNPDYARRERDRNAAYGRALRQLAKRHQSEFRQLLAAEHAKTT